MNSQNSQLDSLNIHFVVFSTHENEQSCSEDMWDAYNKCADNDLHPRWITEEECRKMDPTKTDIFVFEEFSGDIFEHLRQYRCLIVGPPCLLRCFLTCEPIPEGVSPVYTTSMQGLVVTASGLGKEKKAEIQKLIEFMGGIYCKEFLGCITHLIASSATSTKFEIACNNSIPIYTCDWIKQVWQENLKTFIKATDPRFDKYKCPVFFNIVVTTSNIGKRDKENIKQLITSHGGEFMGPLDGTKVNVVITNESNPNSEKVKYARKNKLPCVKQDWVLDSSKAGYALPLKDYLITVPNTMKCSTPEPGCSQRVQESFDCSGVSIIPDTTRNFINETMQSTISSASGRESLQANHFGVLETLNIKEIKKAGPFLDGCNIYLAGFAPQQRDKVSKILNAGSATRFDDLSDNLSHVIVGDKNKAAHELKLIKSKGLTPHIVTVNWLEESVKLMKPAPEDEYNFDKTVAEHKTTEPASPLSKKSIQMLQKPRRPPVPKFSFPEPQDEEPDIVQQYLQKSCDKPLMCNGEPSEAKSELNKSQATKTASDFTVSASRNLNSVSMDNDSNVTQSTFNGQIFEGLTFLLIGFHEDEYQQISLTLQNAGAKVVPSSFKGIPDYTVVPTNGAQVKHTVGEVVTPLFYDDCFEYDKVVEVNYYHKPLSIPSDAKPLKDCVIAISGYGRSERIYLQDLAVALGANYQDTFARRTNPEKGQIAATHLICLEPTGKKYNAAVRWNLPAVEAKWLIACSERLILVDETPFLVGETVAPNRQAASQMDAPKTPIPRQILTPKRRLSQTSGPETPLVNKRLNLAGQTAPNTPYHGNTPETPYGLTMNPNPSKTLKKALSKWISDCPVIKPVTPRPRNQATPLSELKRQLWSAMTKPNPHEQSIDLGQEEQLINSRENSQLGAETPLRDGVTANSTHLSVNDEHHMSLEEDNEPVAKQLFATELEAENNPVNPINEQLEHMNKLLNSARGSSTESRCSINGNRVYEEPKEHINYLIPDTQPESVGWEDPRPPKRMSTKLNSSMKIPESSYESTRLEISIRDTPRRRFMLSGVKDKINYEEAIRQLGGEISPDTSFDPTATHLLCLRPSRNEKVLGSIASGKWVLHYSYIRDCESAGQFIDEEKYEWGNPKCEKTKELTSQQEKDLAKAVYRWRIELSNKNSGAFENMVAILMMPKEKYAQFERLINAGGGIVVPTKHPFDSPKGKKITHCFIQLSKVEQPVDWAMLASKGILCFLPTYLNLFLTDENISSPRNHVIEDFKKYFSLFPK